MKEKLITKIKMLFKPILFLIVFIFPLSTFAVWAPPLSSPTGNNVLPSLNISATMQEKFGILKTLGGIVVTFWIRITDGNQALNKVLASDALGFGNWRTLAELGVGTGDGGSGNVDNGNIDGTTNFITKWTGPHTLGNSQIFDNGTNLGIGTQSPTQKLDVTGNVKATQFCLPGTNPTGGCIGVWPGGGGSSGGWTDDGDIVRLTTSTDFVGIGTNSPTQQLEITKNFGLPATASGGTAGVVFLGGDRFIHNFGTENMFVGRNAGNFSISGDYNTGVGIDALKNLNSGDRNTAVGPGALMSVVSGSNNTAVGKDALRNSTASYNVAVGHEAIMTLTGGGDNVALGNNALRLLSNDSGNTAIGYNSLDSITEGDNITALGYNTDVANGKTNVAAIGANAFASQSHTMVFGDGDVVGWGFGVQPGAYAIRVGTDTLNGNGARLTLGGVWQNASDISKKHDIKDILYGLDEVLALHPVEFRWKNSTNNQKDIGFIAQEVEKVIPEIVSGVDGDKAVGYANLTPVLVQAIKELNEENEMLERRIETLKQKLGI